MEHLEIICEPFAYCHSMVLYLFTKEIINVFFFINFPRWKEDEDGNLVQKEGKNVLEFVAVKSTSNSVEWEIPGV